MTKKKVIAMYAVFFAMFILVAGIVIYILKDKIWPPKPDPDPSTETSVSETTELSTSPTEPETATEADTFETTVESYSTEQTVVNPNPQPQPGPIPPVPTPDPKSCDHDWIVPDKPCIEVAKCRKCGLEEPTPRSPHNWTVANCATPKTCRVCGTTEGSTDPNNHVYVDGVCKYCNEPSVTQQGDSDSGKSTTQCKHVWTAATCLQPATCKRCGETKGDLGPHAWYPANCQKPKRCDVCKKTEGGLGDHIWIAATCTTPKTCKLCGTQEGEPQHDWCPATCIAPKTCQRCGKELGKPDTMNGHDWEDEGDRYVCKICGSPKPKINT